MSAQDILNPQRPLAIGLSSGKSQSGGKDSFQQEPPTSGVGYWLGKFKRELIVVAIFSMVANLMMLAPTLYMLQVYDRVLSSRSELTLIVISAITLFLFAVMAFAEWSRSRVLVRAGIRMDEVLAAKVFRASFDAHLAVPVAAPGRPMRDLTELRQFLTGNGIIAAFDTPWVPIYVVVLFLLHPVLGWTAIGFALLQAAIAYWGHRRSVGPAQALAEAQSTMLAQVQTKLRMAEAVVSMGMVERLLQRWNIHHQKYIEQHASTNGSQHRLTALSKWVRYVQQSLSLGVGALLVIDGQLSPGAMIAANVLMSRALAPIDMLVGTWRSFLSARDAYRRLDELLVAFGSPDQALTKVPPSGSIHLDRVGAGAPGTTVNILQDIELTLDPGSVTVVIGASGSGKSTLARVILGVWPTQTGTVWWGERPLDSWAAEERGASVGYLPQDVELFEGTMADNIARMGEVNAEWVISAAQMAGLHDVLLRLPKGYDTRLGEAGGVLSGGLRQRLGLARALYGKPGLVVLDEPNANLDEVGEQALSSAVQQLKAKGASVVLISHRQQAIALADQLVIVKGGRISASGPRDVVLASLRANAAPS